MRFPQRLHHWLFAARIEAMFWDQFFNRIERKFRRVEDKLLEKKHSFDVTQEMPRVDDEET